MPHVRKVLLFSLVFFLLVPVIAFLVFHFSSPTDAGLETIKLQNGDLILRRGRSIESFAVFMADKNRDFSHIGIVAIENGEPFVIHAVPGESGKNPERVIKERPEIFLSREKASHYAIYRSIFSAWEREKVAAKALEYYYNGVEFDHEYNLDSDQKVYCTELVFKAYQQLSIDIHQFELKDIHIFSGTRKILFPGSFITAPQFFPLFSN